MNFLATINYESGKTEWRYIYVPEVSNTIELRSKVQAALNANPIYEPWDTIECSLVDSEVTVDGVGLDRIRITREQK